MVFIFRNLAVLRLDVSKGDGKNGRFNMWCLQVIDIPEYGAFFVINNIFHEAPVALIILIAHFI